MISNTFYGQQILKLKIKFKVKKRHIFRLMTELQKFQQGRGEQGALIPHVSDPSMFLISMKYVKH